MQLKKFSLRTRIFMAMILIVVIASILIALITIYQYQEQSNDYHELRLDRKEKAIMASIDLELQRTTYPVETKLLHLIFKDRIYDISEINNLDVNIYSLDGALLISSSSSFLKDTITNVIPVEVLEEISQDASHRVVNGETKNNIQFQASYTYINDNKFKPIGILHLPYLEDNTFQEKELREFLFRLGMVYLLMLLIAVLIAYFVSKYITKSIKNVSEKINQTRLDKRNEKIILNNASEEIFNLVNAYNDMVDELGESAVKLAKSEREQAWREMAKQVAHEIKNPLTPMRLTVQSFEQRFDANDPKIKEKINEFSKSLIQQIDTLSSIASAFSSFAEMPKQKREELNVIEVVKLALDIFNESYIHYFHEEAILLAKLDKTQLIRIVTNLVKNASQSLVANDDPKIEVKVSNENGNVIISVADNGKGITPEDENRIFEPKFTTKSSGMGLGLPMIKNIVEAYNGTITFASEINRGTVFTVTIPKK
jgi:two-component system nitrogen regulation sensor histidine kinase NtrY